MYNTKFILENGKEVYPGYLDKEQRQKLKDEFGDNRAYMQCGCRPDKELFYLISEDLKIYPAHKLYQHDRYCSRFKDENGRTERQTAYLINEEDGEVTAYCSFNPKEFSTDDQGGESEQDNEVPEEQGDEEMLELVVEKDDAAKEKEKKEPKLSLPALIRSINVDSYTEKVLNNRFVNSKETFSKFVYYRMKKVRIDKTRKSIGDLTLENDGVRFIYLPFVDAIKRTERGLTKSYIKTKGPDGKEYTNFIFPETLVKELEKFKKTYGMSPNENTMIAGFQYLKKSRKKQGFRVLGRIHLFQVSDIGIYSRSVSEAETFDALCAITKEDPKVKFWIPPEDEDVGALIQVGKYKKKILLLFKARKEKHVELDTSMYEPFVVEDEIPITRELLYSLLDGRTSESSWLDGDISLKSSGTEEPHASEDMTNDEDMELPPLPEDDYTDLPPLPEDEYDELPPLPEDMSI